MTKGVFGRPLAHSRRRGAPEQLYRDHVAAVRCDALRFALAASGYSSRWRELFMGIVDWAATYHDLGKLDEIFQRVLKNGEKNVSGFNHVDAGTAFLLKQKQFEAAIIAYSHHIGLPSFPEEVAKLANGKNLVFRDVSTLEGAPKRVEQAMCDRTDENLYAYLRQHHAIIASLPPIQNRVLTGLVRRLALSCLVDADHGDTARHYLNEREVAPPRLNPIMRLGKLDVYVRGLAERPTQGQEGQRRVELRQKVYDACRSRETAAEEKMLACDCPVGTGKTTAVMAHLLRIAAERGLRRVIVVLPFTNIIDQSVAVYRRALKLDDESEDAMQSVVAAHHHRADYASYEGRYLASRWDAPIVVTTAVQFFETLAASDTGALRKIHNLPGSAIFVDEAHAAIPAALWPQMFRWLRELCYEWNSHIVLASGTLPHFWNSKELFSETERIELPDLISEQVRREAMDLENKRVLIRTKKELLSISGIAHFIQSKPGPRLVIFNTVQSAAVFADFLRTTVKPAESGVEHISTALTPRDRALTLERVRARLNAREDDWTLVATSCVEAGVDLSFRSAFRESWGLVNLFQIAGRVSRSAEYKDSEVWDFQHDSCAGLTLHSQADLPRSILAQLFEERISLGQQLLPTDCSEALNREMLQDCGDKSSRVEAVQKAELSGDYPKVATLCRVIECATCTAIVEKELVRRLQNPDRSQWPDWKDVQLGSVQLWSGKETSLRLPEVQGLPGVFRWNLDYDGFLGYMKGLLPLIKCGMGGLEPL